MGLEKTLTFDEEVLDVLRGIGWLEGGLLGKLPPGQLSRGLYLRVNKALEAMGGKWNRKRKGHVFPTDPRPRVDGLLDSGTLTVRRDGFFETPAEVVKQMLALACITHGDIVLEPSAGRGAIAAFLRALPCALEVCEINPERAQGLKVAGYNLVAHDFFDLAIRPVYDVIMMNPPFEEGQDIDHVRRAFDFLAPGGKLVSVMSAGVFFRRDRKASAFRLWLGDVGRSERLPPGSFKESGTMVSAHLVVITKPFRDTSWAL